MAEYVDPTRQDFGRFKDLPRDQEIQMLNLVQLNATAKYEDGTMVTGREAYLAYGRDSRQVFEALGGKIIWSGNFELMLIGPQSEKWDICFIAQYPNAEAFIAMVRDPIYRQAVKHRQVAVKNSRLIRLSPHESGDGFG